MTRLTSALCLFAAVCWTAGPAHAQKSEPRVVSLKSAADQLPLSGTYYAADPSKITGGAKAAAVVIMLHGSKFDRLVWEKKPTVLGKPLAEVLNDEGFAVFTLDLRGHGESPLPGGRALRNNDYAAMLGDVEAAKRFLMEEHEAGRLNINKLGIIAADESVPVALNYAAADWQKPDYDDSPTPAGRTPRGRDVRALVLFSPDSSAGQLRSLTGVRFTRNPDLKIATLVAYSEEDPQDDGLSERIGKQLRADDSPDDEYFVMKYPGRFRGTDLVGDKNLRAEVHAVNFLKKFLGELDSEWVTRKSRLVR